MAWNELDFEHGLWLMPETKAGCPVVVPLVPAAVNILHNRRAAASDSPYVFPGRNGRGHLMEIYGAWRRILKRAKIADRCTPHDLRRTLGSWQAMNGASLLTIGKSLGHTSTTATAIYSRLTLAPVRDSMNKAVDAMKKSELAEQVCGGIDNGNLLYRPQRLPELVARGMVVNVRGVGFYRPDAPPPGAIELG
jgi:integrase